MSTYLCKCVTYLPKYFVQLYKKVTRVHTTYEYLAMYMHKPTRIHIPSAGLPVYWVFYTYIVRVRIHRYNTFPRILDDLSPIFIFFPRWYHPLSFFFATIISSIVLFPQLSPSLDCNVTDNSPSSLVFSSCTIYIRIYEFWFFKWFSWQASSYTFSYNYLPTYCFAQIRSADPLVLAGVIFPYGISWYLIPIITPSPWMKLFSHRYTTKKHSSAYISGVGVV